MSDLDELGAKFQARAAGRVGGSRSDCRMSSRNLPRWKWHPSARAPLAAVHVLASTPIAPGDEPPVDCFREELRVWDAGLLRGRLEDRGGRGAAAGNWR